MRISRIATRSLRDNVDIIATILNGAYRDGYPSRQTGFAFTSSGRIMRGISMCIRFSSPDLYRDRPCDSHVRPAFSRRSRTRSSSKPMRWRNSRARNSASLARRSASSCAARPRATFAGSAPTTIPMTRATTPRKPNNGVLIEISARASSPGWSRIPRRRRCFIPADPGIAGAKIVGKLDLSYLMSRVHSL